MSIKLLLEFAVVLGAIFLGSRSGGVGLGLWGGVGILVLSYFFGLPPTSAPIDVMLIILAVVMAASVMEAAGGIDYLVGLAERIIRRNPKHITIVAPFVAYVFSFGSGTGHVFYPLLPIIYEVAYENGIRPERPLSVSTIASQQAITASPVSAAMAGMIALYEPLGLNLIKIMCIALPATLIGIAVAALVQMKIGKELKDDPEYNRRLREGLIQPPTNAPGMRPESAAVLRLNRTPDSEAETYEMSIQPNGTAAVVSAEEKTHLPPGAKISALMFLFSVALVVLSGLFPGLRPQVPQGDAFVPLGMATAIQIVMLATAALILAVTKPPTASIPKTNVAQAGLTAVIGIFGLAWLGDTFIKGNEKIIMASIGDLTTNYPFLFAVALFFASVLLFSQAATTRALMPLGISLGIPHASLVGMWPAVNGYFFLPTYGSLIAAISFDHSGTTRIGRYILNHSFMIPGLVSTITAVAVGLAIAKFFF
ncbi:MAG: anaerobic C4-dicarboxylate transporter [Syntrophobacteraceae bacterium]|nr:anaerobic C4-dicarboxylate transporter [Desulfobacteraceae bacterium]